jgi:hypothetical protein
VKIKEAKVGYFEGVVGLTANIWANIFLAGDGVSLMESVGVLVIRGTNIC